MVVGSGQASLCDGRPSSPEQHCQPLSSRPGVLRAPPSLLLEREGSELPRVPQDAEPGADEPGWRLAWWPS